MCGLIQRRRGGRVHRPPAGALQARAGRGRAAEGVLGHPPLRLHAARAAGGHRERLAAPAAGRAQHDLFVLRVHQLARVGSPPVRATCSFLHLSVAFSTGRASWTLNCRPFILQVPHQPRRQGDPGARVVLRTQRGRVQRAPAGESCDPRAPRCARGCARALRRQGVRHTCLTAITEDSFVRILTSSAFPVR